MQKLMLPFILFFIIKTSYSQTIQASYTGCWAETIWKFEFAKDSTYKRTSSGHYGNTIVSGKYKINSDTLILLGGYENTSGTVNKYYLIDGDSCIIDLKLLYDYCTTRPKKVTIDGEVWGNFEGSRKRVLPAKTNKIVYTLDHKLLEACETGIGNCKPVTIVRKSINDSISLFFPNGGTQSDAYLVSVTSAKEKIELHDSKIHGQGQLKLDLTGIPDGKYRAGIMSCHLGGSVELNIVTAIFTVAISIPQSSGIASARFVNYKVTNDTLYVIDNGCAIDTAHVPVTKAKYPVSKELMQKLKETVAQTDSLGHHFNFCVPTVMGWPRFFIWFDDNGREADGFLANIYRKHIFDIVDVFNEIYPGGLIVYDKQELMKREKECDEDWKQKVKEEK